MLMYKTLNKLKGLEYTCKQINYLEDGLYNITNKFGSQFNIFFLTTGFYQYIYVNTENSVILSRFIEQYYIVFGYL